MLIGEKDFLWEPASGGGVPPGAVATGKDGNEDIYIGRAPFQGTITIGKVHPSHGCLYLGFNGKEERSISYEVLVHKKRKSQFVFDFLQHG